MSDPKDDWLQQELEEEYDSYGESQKRELGIWPSQSDD